MKFKDLKNKKAVMTGGAILATATVLGGMYYYLASSKFGDDKSAGTETTVTPATSQKDADSAVTPTTTSSSDTTANTDASTPQAVSYEITGVNKSDGDVFSLPDRITFNISPAVDSTRARLLFQDGTSLYDKTVSGSVGDLTVYPEKKLQAGATGTIVIQGTKDGQVVVTKEIKVVF